MNILRAKQLAGLVAGGLVLGYLWTSRGSAISSVVTAALATGFAVLPLVNTRRLRRERDNALERAALYLDWHALNRPRWGITLADDVEAAHRERSQRWRSLSERFEKASDPQPRGYSRLVKDNSAGLSGARVPPFEHLAAMSRLDALTAQYVRGLPATRRARFRWIAQSGGAGPDAARHLRALESMDVANLDPVIALYTLLNHGHRLRDKQTEASSIVHGAARSVEVRSPEDAQRFRDLAEFIIAERPAALSIPALGATPLPGAARAIEILSDPRYVQGDAESGGPPRAKPALVLLRGSQEPNAPSAARNGATRHLTGVASLKACA